MVLLTVWIPLISLTVCRCAGIQVTVREERKFAMLFQSVVLPCQYSTTSLQTPVVQWWYKSYCQDRTRDSFNFPESLGLQGSELGSNSQLDCSDSSRTVRIVASGQGSSMALAEHYKGRDIAIINRADLRIGQLQWGDSGVYYCKVVISDDVEGRNEAHVQLLVLGRISAVDDLLPGFELDFMPEWVFVGVVVVGSLLFILLVGICWCQCCPHSCCCYVPCCCCPDTCCCPRHLYEAGKAAKSMSMPHMAMYPAYCIPSVPTMVSVTPPSVIEHKMAPTPSAVANNITGVCGGYRVQRSQDQDSMKVLNYIERELAQFNPSKSSCNTSRSMSELSSLHDGDIPFKHSYRQAQRMALPPIADLRATMSSMDHQTSHQPYHSSQQEEPHYSRWNPRSEHLQRKSFGPPGRTGSLDELEEFAQSYSKRGRRANNSRELEEDEGFEARGRKPYQSSWEDPPQYHEFPDNHRHGRTEREERRKQHSPPPSPSRRRHTADSEYDHTHLNNILQRKARDACHTDTSSKGSSKKSTDCYQSRSPSNRPKEDESLPPYSELTAETRAYPHTRPNHSRKVNPHLSRDSLIV